MKKSHLLRIAAAAVLICTWMSGCGQKPNNGQGSEQPAPGEGGKLFSAPTEISILVGSHPSWPYNENWKVWQYIKEATGADVKIQSFPNEEYNTKLFLLLSTPEALPDLVHLQDKQTADEIADVGAAIALEDYMDQMPNFKAFVESLPGEKGKQLMEQRRAGDGKVHYAPVYGTETVTNLKTWLYRKDIFEKHSLQLPTTMEELRSVSEKLKELYPESYPFCMRSGLDNLDIIGPQWKKNFSRRLYYDFEEKSWHFGAGEDTMRTMIEYLKGMVDDGLLPPDFLTMTGKNWEELVSTDRGFMMPDFIVRVDFFNVPMRKENPDFTLAAFEPMIADEQNGHRRLAKFNVDPTGFLVMETGKKDRMENAVKYLDWMYSDEAYELLSWGREGETYQAKDGAKEFILKEASSASMEYGLLTYGAYQRVQEEAMEAAYSKEQGESGKKAAGWVEEQPNPYLWVSLTSEEQSRAAAFKDELFNYADEQISKFILGQRPLHRVGCISKGAQGYECGRANRNLLRALMRESPDSLPFHEKAA